MTAEQEATEKRWQAKPVADHESADYQIINTSGYVIARVYYAPDGAANPARLMAAAPKLLEALKKIAEEGSGRVDWSSLVHAMRHEARAAIAEVEAQP